MRITLLLILIVYSNICLLYGNCSILFSISSAHLLTYFVNVFDPQIVVLSGSIIFKSPLFFETSRQEAMERIFTYKDIQKKVEIVRGNDKIAPALGSVALVLQSIF